MSLCFFPFAFLHSLYSLFASLHYPLYHGAKCLAQRFGFAAIRVIFLLATPAASACSMRNSSILVDLVSLSSLYCSFTFLNAPANSYVAVCSFHFRALSMYSCISDSPIHSIVSPFYAGVDDMAFLWSAVAPGVMEGGVVDRVGCVGRSEEIVEEKSKQSAEEHN